MKYGGTMENPQKAADFITKLRLDLKQEDAIPEDFRPADPNEGYRVQKEVVKRLLAEYGGKTVGYKVACTNKLAQKLLNLSSPFYGCLLSSLVHTSPARVRAKDFSMQLIEPEFAFEMAKDLPAKDTPYTTKEVSAAVGAVLPVIEIVDTRFTDWTTVGVPSLISDNGCNGAWVMGASYTNWQALDLETHAAALIVNGETKLTGNGAAVLGHPLNSLTWLANALCEQGIALKAGEFVSTGVCTDVYHASPDDDIVADFGKIGDVRVSFMNT